MSEHPTFKGYIHDLGGPTANFQGLACDRQQTYGPCPTKECLYPPLPCVNLKDYHGRYLDLLEAIESLPPLVKKVFIRSGIRYDYLLEVCDEKTRQRFMNHLVRHNVSGQLKVAPEHVSDKVLDAMGGKPRAALFDEFTELYQETTEKAGKKQYLIPYFIAAHPGSTLEDAITLALYLHKLHFIPDQVQEFTQLPGQSQPVCTILVSTHDLASGLPVCISLKDVRDICREPSCSTTKKKTAPPWFLRPWKKRRGRTCRGYFSQDGKPGGKSNIGT